MVKNDIIIDEAQNITAEVIIEIFQRKTGLAVYRNKVRTDGEDLCWMVSDGEYYTLKAMIQSIFSN